MRLTKYKVELDDNKHNILVKESACNFDCGDALDNPKAVAHVLNAVYRLSKQAEEHAYMIALNTKSKPLGVFEVSHGGVAATFFNPREILIRALLCGAAGVILAHNHPSGDCTPSKDDIGACVQLKKAADIIGVKLTDNIIIGENEKYFSFQQNNMI